MIYSFLLFTFQSLNLEKKIQTRVELSSVTKIEKTRPDTRLPKSRAGRQAGAIFEVIRPFRQEQWGKKKIIKKRKV